MKKSQESSGLKEKLRSAELAFSELKGQAEASGKKLVSITSVSKKANIDRSYLYGNINTPDQRTKKAFEELGQRISQWKQDFPSSAEHGVGLFRDELKQLKRELNVSIQQNAKLLFEANEIRSQFKMVCQQRDTLLNDLTRAEKEIFKLQAQLSEKTESKKRNGKVQAVTQRPVVISPDTYLYVDKAYMGNDPYQRKVAWAQAKDELTKELSKPIATTIYITIGIQASGKSTWSGNLKSEIERKIIFDATNLTMVDRFDLLSIVRDSRHKNLKVCAVCFPINLDIAKQRNITRTASRRVPEDVIEKAYADIEFPTVTGLSSREQFDEILIVKGIS